ncbi:MAG: nucleoside-diphosphate kinase [Gammaproteobacteria bacterium]|nr:nucleoside-diphosphate kinase [Gammaproteobacteria bacterium]
MSERTLSMIKPDGVARDLIGEIYRRFEAAGLHVVGARMIRLDQRKARAFYQVHRERPFFDDLVAYMTSGPIMVQVLEGENAIQRNRELMGATDPARAVAGTVRADYGESVERNVVHGSDGPGTAREEIDFFFQPDELHSR